MKGSRGLRLQLGCHAAHVLQCYVMEFENLRSVGSKLMNNALMLSQFRKTMADDILEREKARLPVHLEIDRHATFSCEPFSVRKITGTITCDGSRRWRRSRKLSV